MTIRVTRSLPPLAHCPHCGEPVPEAKWYPVPCGRCYRRPELRAEFERAHGVNAHRARRLAELSVDVGMDAEVEP